MLRPIDCLLIHTYSDEQLLNLILPILARPAPDGHITPDFTEEELDELSAVNAVLLSRGINLQSPTTD